jgi:hypothetical protein
VNQHRFDELAQAHAAGLSRRQVMKRALLGAAGLSTGAGFFSAPQQAPARALLRHRTNLTCAILSVKTPQSPRVTRHACGRAAVTKVRRTELSASRFAGYRTLHRELAHRGFHDGQALDAFIVRQIGADRTVLFRGFSGSEGRKASLIFVLPSAGTKATATAVITQRNGRSAYALAVGSDGKIVTVRTVATSRDTRSEGDITSECQDLCEVECKAITVFGCKAVETLVCEEAEPLCELIVGNACDHGPLEEACIQACRQYTCGCPPGSVYQGGQCVPCPPGQVPCGNVCCPCPAETPNACGDVCVDLNNDNANCGQCGLGCLAGTQCCSGHCKDLQSDPQNCNQCGQSCTPGFSCVSGDCVCGSHMTCPAGQACCSDSCTDIMNDPQNCGKCGHQCADAATCQSGQCTCGSSTPCSPGLTCCNGVCVNLNVDDQNCGVCGQRCQAPDICCNGSCASCPSGETLNPATCRCEGACYGLTCPDGKQCCQSVGNSINPATGQPVFDPCYIPSVQACCSTAPGYPIYDTGGLYVCLECGVCLQDDDCHCGYCNPAGFPCPR